MRATTTTLSLIVGALLLSGCLGNDAGDVAKEITHLQEGRSFEDGERVTLVGSLHAEGGVARLCAAQLASYPPQCGQPSIEVEGLDLDGMEGIEHEQGISWSQGDLQINGTIRDGVLHAD